jgi:protein tyrosine phosphatase (PTP) superfamily phosphohydrolase (DUF442 family)
MATSIQEIEAFLPISLTLATSGQPTTDQFTEIAAAGFTLVINLATPASSNWNPEEPTIVNALQMEYVGIPIDWDYPGLSDFEDLADLLDANTERKVWVHCAKNMRVSAMIYLYHRLRKGYSVEVCQRHLQQIWQPNAAWQKFMDAVIELYTNA